MKKLFLLVCMTVLLFSCQKEESPDPEPTPKANYLPLEIGNYWVYEYWDVNPPPPPNERVIKRIDSVIVKRDTTIRNNKYYVVENWLGYVDDRERLLSSNTILRDSSGYIVNEEGRVFFSATNFNDILYVYAEEVNEDLSYTLSYKMEKVETPITVPAGTFDDVLDFKGTAIIYQKDGTGTTKEQSTLYALNVGKIFESFNFANSNDWIEKRLVRYYIIQK